MEDLITWQPDLYLHRHPKMVSYLLNNVQNILLSIFLFFPSFSWILAGIYITSLELQKINLESRQLLVARVSSYDKIFDDDIA